eukprot:3169755-Rhodomonas_salina.2
MPGRGDGSLGISDEERKRRVVEMQRARAEEEAKRQLIAAQFKEDQEMSLIGCGSTGRCAVNAQEDRWGC